MACEALQRSFMATKLSSTVSLPWIWVIEALASFNEIDTSLLIKLLKRTPDISDDPVGRNAREMVSLRVLEGLFFRKISSANIDGSVFGHKIEPDPSERCEDVLRRILSEVPASDLKTAPLDMLKWDVGPFIMKKKSCLPKCSLQQLKNAILDSTSPLSASLKERSGLEIGNPSRNCVPVDCDGLNPGHEVGDMNTEHVAETLGNVCGSSLLPAKRSIDGSTAYEAEVIDTEHISEKSSYVSVNATKKFKHDVVSPVVNAIPDLITESCLGSQPITHSELLHQKTRRDVNVRNLESGCNGGAEPETSSGPSRQVIQQDSQTNGRKYDQECNLPQVLQNGEPSERAEELASFKTSAEKLREQSDIRGSELMVCEALQRSFMATKLSSTVSLPWIWVTEALASFNEIDTSLLINLLKRTPDISDDPVGRNAREMVSLRVLESLFVRKISSANNDVSVSGHKIELDPSERCEGVLRRIMSEVHASDPKTAPLDMVKWDVGQFIMKKKSCLPKCSLQQLKNAILDSTIPLSASLKERSGLEVGNPSRNGVPVDRDGLNPGHEVGDMNTEHVTETLADVYGGTLVPAKGSINDSIAYETEVNDTEHILGNSSDVCVNAAKKFKHDVVSPVVKEIPDLITESCLGSQQIAHSELLRQRLSRDGKVRNLESGCNGGAEPGASSGSLQQVIQQDCQTNGTKCDQECNLPRVLQNGEPSERAEENTKQSHESEFDLAARKNDFLNSQYTQGEEDFTKLNLCVMCNKGGKLLVCSSDSCPLEVHESCLGSAPCFDYNANFYCPFCSYSRAIVVYQEKKLKLLLARKDLAGFICFGSRQRSEKSLHGPRGTKHNQSREDKNEQSNHNEILGNSVSEHCSVDGQQPDKSPLRRHKSKQNQPGGEESSYHNVNANKISMKKPEETRRGQVARNSMSAEAMQMHPPHEHVCQEGSPIEDSSEEDDEIGSRYRVHFRNPQKQLRE